MLQSELSHYGGLSGVLHAGVAVVAAHLVRKLPQEASPLEEHTFVIAERPLSSDSLLLRYQQRSEGTEETAEHFEIIARKTAHLFGRNVAKALVCMSCAVETPMEVAG